MKDLEKLKNTKLQLEKLAIQLCAAGAKTGQSHLSLLGHGLQCLLLSLDSPLDTSEISRLLGDFAGRMELRACGLTEKEILIHDVLERSTYQS